MATKNTTKHIVGGIEDITWHDTLKARAQDLAMDKDHSLTYADRDKIAKSASRKQIVDLYETAYSELAESFHGHLEHIAELEGDKTHLNTLLQDRLSYTLELEERLESASRQRAGLLLLIEQPVKGWPTLPGVNPNQYQAMKPL